MRRISGCRETTYPAIGWRARNVQSRVEEFYKIYNSFNQETGQPILLYALEFKFLRQSYSGTKYPRRNIQQDLAKLRLLRHFATDGPSVDFVGKTRSLIFIGDRSKDSFQTGIANSLKDCSSDEYEVITRDAS
jgi:hypothetical protein